MDAVKTGRICAQRRATGLSQPIYAAMIGIPVRTIRAWEQGYKAPPLYVIDLIDYKLIQMGYTIPKT